MTRDRRDLIASAVTRIPIPPGQITLFKVLFEHPDGLSKREIADLIRDGDEKSLTGVFAALTNRVNGTPGLETTKPGLELLIERDRSSGGSHYRMRPETREVIEGLKPLREAMSRPVEEIRTAFEDERSWLMVER
jgi:hypothetical protein